MGHLSVGILHGILCISFWFSEVNNIKDILHLDNSILKCEMSCYLLFVIRLSSNFASE